MIAASFYRGKEEQKPQQLGTWLRRRETWNAELVSAAERPMLCGAGIAEAGRLFLLNGKMLVTSASIRRMSRLAPPLTSIERSPCSLGAYKGRGSGQ